MKKGSFNNTGLVLEGGALRGIFTAGILDFFSQNELFFPYVIGVSAGGVMGTSYISRQIGRNKTTTINYVGDKRYLSFRNYFKEGSMFGMDFIFNRLPNELEPFDYETFYNEPTEFKIGATDCETGNQVYFSKAGSTKTEFMKFLIASSSMPFLSPMVEINGKKMLDGGLSDSIPIKQSIKDGNHKNVVILTRNKDYRKSPFKPLFLAKIKYRNHKNIIHCLLNRHLVYNATMDLIEDKEKSGEVFVIRPENPVTVRRLEKRKHKLLELYEEGVSTAKYQYELLLKWLG